MQEHHELVDRIREWQNDLLESYQDGRTIHFRSITDRACLAYSDDHPPGQPSISTGRQCHGILPRVKAIVVGLDIREYSRRKPEHQLFLTMNLHVCVKKAIELLRIDGILTESEPRITIQTGDGAYVVFTLLEAHDPFDTLEFDEELKRCVEDSSLEADGKNGLWESEDWKDLVEQTKICVKERRECESNYLPTAAAQAMSFVFALNAIMSGDNARQGFVSDSSKPGEIDSGVQVFPAECRFAVSYDEVLLLDVYGSLNCIGNGIVTCARILSTDHGNHLLLDYELLKGLECYGGLKSLCGGQWGHRLHFALLDDVKVKSGQFRYADVFGFHDDKPLLQALRRAHQTPASYHIGSHNVASLKV